MPKTKNLPLVLVILDGFGVSQDKFGSPWEIANHPNFSEIEKNFPFTTLQASGIAVGLPWGKEGNSEVGHLTIGAGKVILNYLPKISTSIEDGSFFKNPAFLRAIEHTRKNKSSLHIMGLFSSGTVHAYAEHLYALLELVKREGVSPVFLHLFTDGKDAYQKEGAEFFKKLEEFLSQNFNEVKIVSVIGRKYAMDRDNNWERTKKAYDLFTQGVGNKFQIASEYIKGQYEQGVFDSEIEPGVIFSGEGRVKDNDAVIFFNFREDSVRQLTRAFVEENFDKFSRKKLKNLVFVTMTEYEKNLPIIPAFESVKVEWPLARIISEAGLSQLHIAETEKYAHITYFFNGGREEPFDREQRILIESPHVPSYDLVPEMSADKITQAVLENLEKFDFVAVNFANADMVGHTGNLEATARALEKLDECVGKIMKKVLEINGVLIITADHGNAEEKFYKFSGEKKSMHSLNPVPFYLVGENFKHKNPADARRIAEQYKKVRGTLTDIAPTILDLLGIKKPASMTGKSLLPKLTESTQKPIFSFLSKWRQ